MIQRIPLILHSLMSFIYFPILGTFTNCADQTMFDSYGEMVYLKMCDPRGR